MDSERNCLDSRFQSKVKTSDADKKAKGKMTIKYKISRNRASSITPTPTSNLSTLRECKEGIRSSNGDCLESKPSLPSSLDKSQKRKTLGPTGLEGSADLLSFLDSRPSCPNLSNCSEDSHGKEATLRDRMTAEQKAAFKDIFHMFDSNGGGTIRTEDLDQALQSVNIKLTPEEVNELFDGMDVDGNGEIDFQEFIDLVANTEKFIESIVARGNHNKTFPNHNKILFKAIAVFMTKSALASVNEIVRYYHTNAQRYSNPHDVIGHYTAGARLIGLTQRQMRRDMKKLTKISSDNKSPYAQPLVTSLDTFFEEKTQSKKLRLKQRKVKVEEQMKNIQEEVSLNRHSQGKIRLKFLTSVGQPMPSNRRNSLYLQFLSMQRHISKRRNIRKSKCTKNVRTLGFTSPKVSLPQLTTLPEMTSKRNGKQSTLKEKLANDLTIDDLKLIRKQVSYITTNFYTRVQNNKLKEAEKHWHELGSEEISSETLKNGFQKAFLAYTDYRHIPISSIASSYSRTNPLS